MNMHGLRVLHFPESSNINSVNDTVYFNKDSLTHKKVKPDRYDKKVEGLKHRNPVRLSEVMTADSTTDNMEVYLKRQKSESTGDLTRVSLKDEKQLRKRTSSYSDFNTIYKINHHIRDNKIKFRRIKRRGQPVRISTRNYDIDFKSCGDYFNFKPNTNYQVNRLSHRPELNVKNLFRMKSPHTKYKQSNVQQEYPLLNPSKPTQITQINQATHQPLKVLTSKYCECSKSPVEFKEHNSKNTLDPECSERLCCKQDIEEPKPKSVTNQSSKELGKCNRIGTGLKNFFYILIGKKNPTSPTASSRMKTKRKSNRKKRKNLRLFQDDMDDTDTGSHKLDSELKAPWSFDKTRETCPSRSTSKHNLNRDTPKGNAVINEGTQGSKRPVHFYTTHNHPTNRSRFCHGDVPNAIGKANDYDFGGLKQPHRCSRKGFESSSSSFALDKVMRCCCKTVVDTVKKMFSDGSSHDYLSTQHCCVEAPKHKKMCLCRHHRARKITPQGECKQNEPISRATNVDKTKSYQRCDKGVLGKPSSLEIMKQYLFNKTRCIPAPKKQYCSDYYQRTSHDEGQTSAKQPFKNIDKNTSTPLIRNYSKTSHNKQTTIHRNKNTNTNGLSVEHLRKICSSSTNRRLIRRGSNHILRRLMVERSTETKAASVDYCQQKGYPAPCGHSISSQYFYPPEDISKIPPKNSVYTQQTCICYSKSSNSNIGSSIEKYLGKCGNYSRAIKVTDMKRSTCMQCNSKISPVFVHPMDPFKKALASDLFSRQRNLSQHSYKKRCKTQRPRLFQENENEEMLCKDKVKKPVKGKTRGHIRPSNKAYNAVRNILYGITAVFWSPCLLLLCLGWSLTCPMFRQPKTGHKPIFPGSHSRKRPRAQCPQATKGSCNKKADSRGLSAVVSWSSRMFSDVSSVAYTPISSLRGRRRKRKSVLTKPYHREPGVNCLLHPGDRRRVQRHVCCCSRGKLNFYNRDRIVQNVQCGNPFHRGRNQNRHNCPPRSSTSMKIIKHLQRSHHVLSECLGYHKNRPQPRLFNDIDFKSPCFYKKTLSPRICHDKRKPSFQSVFQSTEIAVEDKKYVDCYTSTNNETVCKDKPEKNEIKSVECECFNEKHDIACGCSSFKLLQPENLSNQHSSKPHSPSDGSQPAPFQSLTDTHHPLKTQVLDQAAPNIQLSPPHKSLQTEVVPSLLNNKTSPHDPIRPPVNVERPLNTQPSLCMPLASLGLQKKNKRSICACQVPSNPASNTLMPSSLSAKRDQTTNTPHVPTVHPPQNVQSPVKNHPRRSIIHSSRNRAPVPCVKLPDPYVSPSGNRSELIGPQPVVRRAIKIYPPHINSNSQTIGPSNFIKEFTFLSSTSTKNEVSARKIPTKSKAVQSTVQKKKKNKQTKMEHKKAEKKLKAKSEKILEKKLKNIPETKIKKENKKPKKEVTKLNQDVYCSCKTEMNSNKKTKTILNPFGTLWRYLSNTVNSIDNDMWSCEYPCKESDSSGLVTGKRRTRTRKPPSSVCAKFCLALVYCATFLCWSPLLCCLLLCFKIRWI